MSNSFKKVWSVITTLIVAAVVLLAFLLVGVRLFGLRAYVVLSGSMEPAYPTGSLIYVKKTDPSMLKEGDVISFKLNENTIATHRITAIIKDENDPTSIRFKTKGDANDVEDGSTVAGEDVAGVPVFTIPKLGYFANYIQHPPGIYVTVAVGAFLMLLMFMPELAGTIKGEDRQKNSGGVATAERAKTKI